MTTTTGGCRCGAVRYAIEAEPLTTRVCWCRDCQYLGAGSGTVNVVFPSDAATISGALAEYESTADSGNVMRRGFCARCGTPLTTQSSARPHLLTVRAGSLDDPEIAQPAITIWTSSAPSWAVFDPRLPREETQPAAAALAAPGMAKSS